MARWSRVTAFSMLGCAVALFTVAGSCLAEPNPSSSSAGTSSVVRLPGEVDLSKFPVRIVGGGVPGNPDWIWVPVENTGVATKRDVDEFRAWRDDTFGAKGNTQWLRTLRLLFDLWYVLGGGLALLGVIFVQLVRWLVASRIAALRAEILEEMKRAICSDDVRRELTTIVRRDLEEEIGKITLQVKRVG